jgi:LytS/YehU family sensor histidine kinase
MSHAAARRFQFDLLSLFSFIALVATLLAIPRNPFFAFVVLCTYLAIRISPLRGQSFLATATHNSLIGFASGLVIAALRLAFAGLALEPSMPGDQALSRIARGLFTGPLIGATVGSICAAGNFSRLRHGGGSKSPSA